MSVTINHVALYAHGLEAMRRFYTTYLGAVVSGPRTTGDGYYEAVVLDPEGNQVEIVA